MKCLYCHENVQPEGETCPKCGLPLIEDTTLLEFRESEKPSFLDWINERKNLILAAAGGFAAALAIGIVFINATAPSPSSQVAVTPSAVPGTAQPVRLTSASPITAATAGAPVTVSDVGPAGPAAWTPTLSPTTAGSPPAAAPVTEADQGDVADPMPLPANFEYDPQWSFAPAPKPRRHLRPPDPEAEPTPPQHLLAMNLREREPQYVIVVPNSVGGYSGGSNSGTPLVSLDGG